MLVLLVGGMHYEVRRRNGPRWHDTCMYHVLYRLVEAFKSSKGENAHSDTHRPRSSHKFTFMFQNNGSWLKIIN
jgi:hypothetical protein